MLDQVRKDLQQRLPAELVNALMTSYDQVKQNYYLGRHEPSELNGGKFVEVCARIIQYETQGGNYAPLGTQIKDMIGVLRSFEQLSSATALESYRIHVPRTLLSIYSIRNKRGVGHIGGDVSPNHADATLIAAAADWTMAELIRIYYGCPLDDAQTIVDGLVQRKIPLVQELGTYTRVLLPALTQRDQTLLLLSIGHPSEVAEADLVASVEPKSIGTYRRVLGNLHAERLAEYSKSAAGRHVTILPPGIAYVDAKYGEWLRRLNEGRA